MDKSQLDDFTLDDADDIKPRAGRPRKGNRKYQIARSVRLEDEDELRRWTRLAKREGVSLSQLMLYAIRRTVADLESGALELPKETEISTRIRMP